MSCPRHPRLAALAATLLLAASPLAPQPAFRFADEERVPERYQTGGTTPLPPNLQQMLDRHAGILGLGLNTDWMAETGLRAEAMVAALASLAEGAQSGEWPGAVLHVSRVGAPSMPLSVGYLMTDPQRVLNEHSTLYELGELTGFVTAVPLTLAAIERGDLDLDDTLGELLPEISGAGKETITVEMLLRHRSGLPRHLMPPDGPMDREGAVAFLNQIVPVSPPGTAMRLSRYNHLLLGLILEGIHATPFQQLAREQIFEPFGMATTTFEPPPAWRCVIAAGPYQQWRGRMSWGEPTDPITEAFGRSAASGGLVASADDLGAFAIHMMPQVAATGLSLITSETLALALTAPPGCSMGLGIELGRFGPGSFGFDAAEGPSLWILPQEQAYVVFLSNLSHPDGEAGLRRDPRREVFRLVREGLKPLAAGATLTPPAPKAP